MVTSLEVWHKRVNKINEGGNEPSLSCHISPVKEYVRQKFWQILQTALDTHAEPSGPKGAILLLKIYRLRFVDLVFVLVMRD